MTAQKQYKIYRVQISGSGQEKINDLSKIMARLAWEGKRNRFVRLKALEVVKKSGVKPHDWVNEAKAIMSWIQHNVPYFLDPKGVEYFQTPERTLIDRAGDCDDLAILYAAMMGSIGHRSAFILTDPTVRGQISHAMGAVNFAGRKTPYGNKWVSVELTDFKPFGWIPPKSSMRIIVEIPK